MSANATAIAERRHSPLLIVLALWICLGAGCGRTHTMRSTMHLEAGRQAALQVDPRHHPHLTVENDGPGAIDVCVQSLSLSRSEHLAPGDTASLDAVQGIHLILFRNASAQPATIHYALRGQGGLSVNLQQSSILDEQGSSTPAHP